MKAEVLIAVPFFLVLAGCGSTPHPVVAAAPSKTVPVKVVAAARCEWPATYEATGTVRARSSTVIAAKWMGYVREVRVHLGDRVQAGQMLVLLDTRDLDASSARAAAAREAIRSGIPEADSAVRARMVSA